MAFDQQDWLGFISFFAVSFMLWIFTFGVGYYQTWYKNLWKVIRARYGGMAGWDGVPHWAVFLVQLITYSLVWLAAFLWWRNLFGEDLWNWALTTWAIALALWKLYDPIVMGGWGGDNPSISVTRGLLIWGAVHVFLTWLAVSATAVLMGIGAANAPAGDPTTAGWVAFAFVAFWWIVVTFQFVWSIMAAVAWDWATKRAFRGIPGYTNVSGSSLEDARTHIQSVHSVRTPAPTGASAPRAPIHYGSNRPMQRTATNRSSALKSMHGI